MTTIADLQKKEASRKHAIMAVASAGTHGLDTELFDEKLGDKNESLRLYNQGIIKFDHGKVHLTTFGRKLAKGR